MRLRVLPALLAVFVLAACTPPKYASHESVFRDFTASVPWGWSVMTEAQGDAFTEVRFIGPFDRDFFLGAPSLSVRWYKNRAARELRGGGREAYSSPDDFIDQTLKSLYGGEDSVLYVGSGESMAIAKKPQEITLKGSGLKAKQFVVLSPAPAPESNLWGVEQDAAGRAVNVRKHAYAVVPLRSGFYVLTYPATRRGYPKFEDRFLGLLGTFKPLTAGPGGPKLGARPAGA